MPNFLVHSDQAPAVRFTDKSKPSPLAQAIRAGDLLCVSGHGPLDPATRERVPEDISPQTVQTLRILQAVLAAGGATRAQVENMRVCRRDIADFPAFNEAFREFTAGENVTRTCAGGTPHRKGVRFEIDGVTDLG